MITTITKDNFENEIVKADNRSWSILGKLVRSLQNAQPDN